MKIAMFPFIESFQVKTKEYTFVCYTVYIDVSFLILFSTKG